MQTLSLSQAQEIIIIEKVAFILALLLRTYKKVNYNLTIKKILFLLGVSEVGIGSSKISFLKTSYGLRFFKYLLYCKIRGVFNYISRASIQFFCS